MVLGVSLATLMLMVTCEGSAPSGRMHVPRGRNMPQDSSAAHRTMVRSVKTMLRHYVKSLGHAPVIYPLVNIPAVKRVLANLPVTRVLYGSRWDRKHPFDRVYGTDTSGFLCGEEVSTGHPAEEHGSPYAGVQPSVLRRVLEQLPGVANATFIDLGCGKGRPMLIASEFPFRDIVGVELSPMLAEVAAKNAAIIAKRYPERTPVRVDVGDATAYPMPDGDVVLFIYNSFDRELMKKVSEGVEAALRADANRSVYVVYCNPASGDCFDESPLLTRRFAQMLRYSKEELGYAEDQADAVVIWQGGSAPAPSGPANAKIVIVKDRWRAELQEENAA